MPSAVRQPRGRYALAANAASSALLRRHNEAMLLAYAQRRDPQLRRRLIEANLPLVRRIAARLAPSTDLPLDDLIQSGCLGLIRAVDGYDPRHGTALSSFAVPYVRGAMLQHLRDRHPLLRVPRRLRELQQQRQRLVQQRQHSGLEPLSEEGLAEALGVTPQRLQEAERAARAEQLRSLDEPGADGDGDATTGLEQLADPSSSDGDQESDPAQAERCRWLRRRLQELEPGLRRLLEGRLLEERPWAELGAELGLHPRLAQRRLAVLLEQLRSEGMEAPGGA